MTILNETYTLANGIEIPKLGLGTWLLDDDMAALRNVSPVTDYGAASEMMGTTS